MDEREKSDDWQIKVIKDFAQWLDHSYNKISNKKFPILGSDELLYLEQLIEQRKVDLL